MRRNFVKSGDAPNIGLYYHGVANVRGQKINLPLEKFAEQIDHITKYYGVVSLDEAHKQLCSGYNSNVAVATTLFDDGFQKDLILLYLIWKHAGCLLLTSFALALAGKGKSGWVSI